MPWIKVVTPVPAILIGHPDRLDHEGYWIPVFVPGRNIVAYVMRRDLLLLWADAQ